MNTKVYVVYHAATGMLADFVLAAPPSDEELASIRATLAEKHGHGPPKLNDPTHKGYVEGHPLNGSSWDMRVEERAVLPSIASMLDALKPKPMRERVERTSESEAPKRVVSAQGFVRNPDAT